MKTTEIFISNKSIADGFIKSFNYPFEVLPKINEYIINLGNSLDSNYIKKDNNIWIHKSVIVSDTAKIIGPCIIDEDSEIRHNAFIRENVIIGKNCVVGNSSEIKNSILYDNVQIPHFNYVGDSILGYKSHLGAGAIISNLKADKKDIVIKYNNEIINTTLKKVGAFIGDNVEIGCNSVINPGTIIYPNTNIYPLVNVREIIPGNVIVKDKNIIVEKEKNR